VGRCERIGKALCLRLQDINVNTIFLRQLSLPWWWKQQVPLKLRQRCSQLIRPGFLRDVSRLYEYVKVWDCRSDRCIGNKALKAPKTGLL
jgi:hypothetical protein